MASAAVFFVIHAHHAIMSMYNFADLSVEAQVFFYGLLLHKMFEMFISLL